MPRIPLCLHCDEPVFHEQDDYIDINANDPSHQGPDEWVHVGCWAAYQGESDQARRAS